MTVTVHHGDSREVLKGFADASIDSCVTDPPYALVSISKRFAKGNNRIPPTKNHQYQRLSKGFMGQQWDTGETAFAVEFWAEVFRVMKPGAHLIAFSGTRTYHRLVCAIEDAGFEIRDQIGWLFGSGFPKSHSQAGEWEGWGSALKPAWEPICLARKPMIGTIAANLDKHGTGALSIDACRIASTDGQLAAKYASVQSAGPRENNVYGVGRRRDRSRSTPHAGGRWPANVIHDGSGESEAAFPDGAARFFYSAKADAADRCGSRHPTVKPTDLMAYLCRLVTRPGGAVLDPFAGSGSTGMACLREGFDCVLIEREAQYVADIHKRLAHVEGADTPLFSNDAAQGLFGDVA